MSEGYESVRSALAVLSPKLSLTCSSIAVSGSPDAGCQRVVLDARYPWRGRAAGRESAPS